MLASNTLYVVVCVCVCACVRACVRACVCLFDCDAIFVSVVFCNVNLWNKITQEATYTPKVNYSKLLAVRSNGCKPKSSIR